VDRVDICIIGAGAVGLGIAYQLSHSKALAKQSILILDSLPSFGQSTSSRNSEVIHAGIYYPPGSLKAELCIEGKSLLYQYLREKELPHKQIGKLIVAQAHQEAALQKILDNAKECGMEDLMWLNERQLKSYEPQLTACFALLSPTTGIIDSHAYMASLLSDCQQRGVTFVPNTEVLEINALHGGFTLTTSSNGLMGKSVERYEFQSQWVINAAGLEAHGLAAKIAGLGPSSVPKVHLCKGDYFTYSKPSPFSRLVYPVPEANTAGLGIHGTLDMGNQLRFGPDTEYIDSVHYDIAEAKRDKFAKAIQGYFPQVTPEMLNPAYAGIRPKLAGPGEPAKDFLIQTKEDHGIEGLIQLFGIESPGLTASLAIGNHVLKVLKNQ
jgi:L-2-hydroxyglutarate oxidase LhgO